MKSIYDIGMDLLLVTEPRTGTHESYCELVCHAVVQEILSTDDLAGRLREFVEKVDAQVTVNEDYTVESMCNEGHGDYELPQSHSVVVEKIICTVHDRMQNIARGLGEVLELSARTCDAVLGALVYGSAKSVALERWVVNPGGEGMMIHLLLSHEVKEAEIGGLRRALLDVTESFPELPVGYHAVLVLDSAESRLKAATTKTANPVKKLNLGSLNNDGESTVPATARDIHPVIPSATPREAGELVVENVSLNEPRGPGSDGHRSREEAHHCEEGSPAARRQPSAEAFEFPLEELEAQTRPDLDGHSVRLRGTTLGASVVPVVPEATKEPSSHSQRAAASGSIRRGKYKKPHDS
ncbi:hypothetical protein FOZ60_003024 [Perkinsus olseni]|uniref:Uncharacterized protein n=1 Tax=Perkinsus olseni TaxID=32597 RepID=A0A7J6PJG2_PEROL|nr:hypothetical protein FOZ60_003024 [Perkinsus olseni]